MNFYKLENFRELKNKNEKLYNKSDDHKVELKQAHFYFSSRDVKVKANISEWRKDPILEQEFLE